MNIINSYDLLEVIRNVVLFQIKNSPLNSILSEYGRKLVHVLFVVRINGIFFCIEEVVHNSQYSFIIRHTNRTNTLVLGEGNHYKRSRRIVAKDWGIRSFLNPNLSFISHRTEPEGSKSTSVVEIVSSQEIFLYLTEFLSKIQYIFHLIR